MEEVVTEGEWVSGDYGDFLGLSSEERAIVEQRAERARLEREVVEACRAELAVWEGFHTAGWTTRSASARNRIRKATRALIEFESNQIKK